MHRHEAGLPNPLLRAPHEPFNARVGGRRAVGLAKLPLDDVRAVKHGVDGTVHDVTSTSWPAGSSRSSHSSPGAADPVCTRRSSARRASRRIVYPRGYLG
ncbi:MAG: wax ester/triacylglycerol synthase domain-containing protein [Kineosporiaceae bacterium]